MAELAPFLGKKYKLASSDNFDEYLAAFGIGWVGRKIITSVAPVVQLSAGEDGEYCLSTVSSVKRSETRFRLGEEFEEATADGRRARSVVTHEGRRLTHVQRGHTDTTVVREFSREQLKTVYSVDGVVSTRIYTAV